MIHDFSALRRAFGCFATGVAIITTHDPDAGSVGITVNSFSSVSLEPALLLWCLDKNSDTASVFRNCRNFAVSILRDDHQEISARLSRPGDHSLAAIATQTGKHGCALVEGALATFECAVYKCHDAGDHMLFIGEVLAFDCTQAGQPLLYHRGCYQALERPEGR